MFTNDTFSVSFNLMVMSKLWFHRYDCIHIYHWEEPPSRTRPRELYLTYDQIFSLLCKLPCWVWMHRDDLVHTVDERHSRHTVDEIHSRRTRLQESYLTHQHALSWWSILVSWEWIHRVPSIYTVDKSHPHELDLQESYLTHKHTLSW